MTVVGEGPSRVRRCAPAGGLLLSAVALALAPRLMPAGYDWLRHTTSESAAQGVPGAWLARLGFLLFGLSVVWIASQARGSWSPVARFCHAGFGVLMTATAAFSTRPWSTGAAFDPVEDALHSFTATTMGFAFALGVVACWRQRGNDRLGRILDVLAVAASVVIPLGMSVWPGWAGLAQRAMFTVAYVWYGRASTAITCPGSTTSAPAWPAA